MYFCIFIHVYIKHICIYILFCFVGRYCFVIIKHTYVYINAYVNMYISNMNMDIYIYIYVYIFVLNMNIYMYIHMYL